MSQNTLAAPYTATPAGSETTTFAILVSLSVCHLLNDMNQSLVPALYPVLKETYRLDFGQVGLIALASQLTASMLQPVVGMVTDRRPQPFSLPVGMGCSLIGLLLLAVAATTRTILAPRLWSASAPRCSIRSRRVWRGWPRAAGTASRNRCSRSAAAPARRSVRCSRRSSWYRAARAASRGSRPPRCWRSSCWPMSALVQPASVALRAAGAGSARGAAYAVLSRRRVLFAIAILVALMFSKYVYTSSLSSYYTFYLIHKFGLSVQSAQIHLFVFLASVAAGTFAGGPIGDRFGRKPVIWFSILGAFPFALMLPYANLFWTGILTVAIGLILASAFSAILVYAQDLLPGRVGMVAGMFFGFSFGMGGLGAAALGQVADWTSIETVYRLCSFLPLIGLLTAFLPNIEGPRRSVAR